MAGFGSNKTEVVQVALPTKLIYCVNTHNMERCSDKV